MNSNFNYRPTCEICGSEKKQILFSKKFLDNNVWSFIETFYENRVDKDIFTDADYEVAKCLNCGFIWQTYILKDDKLENLYNIWISSEQSLKKKKEADISLFIKYANQCKRISKLLSKKPYQIDILDFGMGWGYWCLMAKAFGYNIYGFEISKERIKYCKDLGINVIEKYEDIANFQFDFINSEQVFEHIANPLKTLMYLCKSLKSMGVIRISVPNGNSIEKKISQSNFKAGKNAIQPIEHINCFTTATLKKMCESAGLKVIDWLPPATNRIDDVIINLGENFLKLILGKNTNLYFRK